MRNALLALSVLLCSITPAAAQFGVGVEGPGVSIGINLPVYPQLVPVPGYPVYYAPQVNSNYFFYDGMYWVYQSDNWYTSSWYNGPWEAVRPEYMPLFVLRVPVHYYRRPPAYFHGWTADAPPRWGEHWGNGWQQSHNGWDQWNRSAVPAPAPLPVYQRQYFGNQYPAAAQQQVLLSKNYQYQPRDAVVQQRFQAQRAQAAAAPASPAKVTAPQARVSPPQNESRGSSAPPQHSAAPATRAAPAKSETAIVQPPANASTQHASAPPSRGQPQQKGSEDQKSAAVAPAQHAAAQPARGAPPQRAVEVQKPVAAAQPPERVAAPAPRAQPPKKEIVDAPKPAAAAPASHVVAQAPHVQPPQAAPQREQQAPRAQQGENKAPQGKEPEQESRPSPEKDNEKK